MKKNLLILLIFSLGIGCGNADSKTLAHSENKAGSDAVTEKSPCELLPEADLKEYFSLPDDAIAKKKDVLRTYPTCFYEWENILVSKTSVIVGKEYTIDYPSEISLVLVANANQKMFETSTAVYKDGETVEGLGDNAMWGVKMLQLTFLAKGYMIHLHVSMSADQNENKENAIVLAGKIIDRL